MQGASLRNGPNNEVLRLRRNLVLDPLCAWRVLEPLQSLGDQGEPNFLLEQDQVELAFVPISAPALDVLNRKAWQLILQSHVFQSLAAVDQALLGPALVDDGLQARVAIEKG